MSFLAAWRSDRAAGQRGLDDLREQFIAGGQQMAVGVGYAFQALTLALLILASNIRKIEEWLERQNEQPASTPIAAPTDGESTRCLTWPTTCPTQTASPSRNPPINRKHRSGPVPLPGTRTTPLRHHDREHRVTADSDGHAQR